MRYIARNSLDTQFVSETRALTKWMGDTLCQPHAKAQGEDVADSAFLELNEKLLKLVLPRAKVQALRNCKSDWNEVAEDLIA
eukprot:9825507-Alexandrium_andersonii.AAC.1